LTNAVSTTAQVLGGYLSDKGPVDATGPIS
jgi:hypothetical protein